MKVFINGLNNLKKNKMEKEIDVNDYIDVSAILKQLDIENAKQVLRDAGYDIDNLKKIEE